jgi:hypothetical protein
MSGLIELQAHEGALFISSTILGIKTTNALINALRRKQQITVYRVYFNIRKA